MISVNRLLILLVFMALAGCTAEASDGTAIHLGATVSNTTLIR